MNYIARYMKGEVRIRVSHPDLDTLKAHVVNDTGLASLYLNKVTEAEPNQIILIGGWLKERIGIDRIQVSHEHSL